MPSDSNAVRDQKEATSTRTVPGMSLRNREFGTGDRFGPGKRPKIVRQAAGRGRDVPGQSVGPGQSGKNAAGPGVSSSELPPASCQGSRCRASAAGKHTPNHAVCCGAVPKQGHDRRDCYGTRDRLRGAKGCARTAPGFHQKVPSRPASDGRWWTTLWNGKCA